MELSHAETDLLELAFPKETILKMISMVILLLEVLLVFRYQEPTLPPTGKNFTTQVTPKILSYLTQP